MSLPVASGLGNLTKPVLCWQISSVQDEDSDEGEVDQKKYKGCSPNVERRGFRQHGRCVRRHPRPPWQHTGVWGHPWQQASDAGVWCHFQHHCCCVRCHSSQMALWNFNIVSTACILERSNPEQVLSNLFKNSKHVMFSSRLSRVLMSYIG